MELVLGVSMTATTVRLALVEGEKADGVIVDHDVFDITGVDGSANTSASDEVIAAILGTQESAIDAGHHLVSIGVTWIDRAEAAALREKLIARGIDDVLLVSGLHAAAALAQAVGRAVGYHKTGLMFVERQTATLAVVETADGSVVKVLSESLHGRDAIAAAAEMVTALDIQNSESQGLVVVGSGVDVTAVKARLIDIVAVPSIAPEEPQLALARGAALASAYAPRYDPSTIGLAYSQDSYGTTAHRVFMADFLRQDDATPDADIASEREDVPGRGKPFVLVGSSLTAVFIAGMLALSIAVAVNVRPAADQASEAVPARPGTAAAPPSAVLSAPPMAAKQVPKPPPAPAPAPPPLAPLAIAQPEVLPAPPPPQVIVRDVAPAVAPPPVPVAQAPPALPPPVVVPPVILPPFIRFPAPWIPPVLQPPPRVQSPAWYPNPSWPQPGNGGSHRGHGGKKGH